MKTWDIVKKHAILLLLMLAVALPAEASTCRSYHDNLICIGSIKRSAKYYWEYRAAVSVNGVVRPIEIYNCRDRVRVRKDKTVVPFQSHGAGELLCSILNR